MTPRLLVNQIIKDVVRPAFKRAGFVTGRTTFRKEEAGFTKVFSLQHSLFNSRLAAGFDMNAGLYFAAAYGALLPSWLEEPLPLALEVKIQHCQFNFRAVDLTKRPQSFRVDGSTTAAQLKDKVQTEVDDILTWFASIVNLEDCLIAQNQVGAATLRCDFCVALTYAEQGNLLRAQEVAIAYINQFSGPANTRAKLLVEARKRGIELN